MFQELLPLLPKEAGTLALALAMTGTLVGAGLWLAGSRFSRSLITLVMVSAGGWIGMFLPRWFGWPIDGWAPAVGLAIVLGASGFFLHRFWVAVGLGLVLAGWAALATWSLCKGNGGWTPQKYEVGTTAVDYLKELWASLPTDAHKYLPIACGTAMMSGLLTALLWPRVGVILLYSTGGVSMVAFMGLCAMSYARPHWIDSLPATPASQVAMLLAMVLFGALLQWWLAPVNRAMKPPKRGRPLVMVHD